MIRSFRSKETEKVFRRSFSRTFHNIERAARRRLEYLDGASSLADLAAVPGFRFEALKADRAGQYRVRINSQWRICFGWKSGDAYYVEITDYH